MRFVPLTWDATNKPDAVSRIRGWMREERLSLEPNLDLRRELLSFEERVLPSGQISFGARGRAHDDHVALLVTAALADGMGGMPASPTRGPRIVFLGDPPRRRQERAVLTWSSDGRLMRPESTKKSAY